MERRFVLFILISAIVWIGSLYFQKQFMPRPQVMTQTLPAASPPISSTPIAASLDTGNYTAQKYKKAAAGQAEAFENESLLVRFAAEDAGLKNFTLKAYEENKKPVELCPHGQESSFFELKDAHGFLRLDYKMERPQPGTLVLSAASGLQGVWVKKEFSFSNQGYVFGLKISFINKTQKPVAVPSYWLNLGPGLGTYQDRGTQTPLTASTKITGKIYTDSWSGNFLRGVGKFFGFVTGPDPTYKEVRHDGTVDFVSLNSHYFTVALIPDTSFSSDATLITTRPGNGTEAALAIPSFDLAAGSTQEFPFKVYAGPLEYNSLKDLHLSLEKMIYTGWFGAIAIYMLYTLKLLYSLSHNYGVAIILLTILVKVLLWWPTQKSFQSMKKMQKLQPQINALKEKHKSDPKRLNQETMKLFQEHKVNPMGGCLPLLIQMPILYGLYGALSRAIDLRGAPFFWWIQDLSARDSHFILPILMGATQLYQQKISTPDPEQFKKMMFLPIIFVVMFSGMPAGLLLYWVMQNTLSVVQQKLANRTVTN